MWESPTTLWRRLKLGREEYLQRLITTLILDGDAPPWNTPRAPGAAGQRFLHLLDATAHGPSVKERFSAPADKFVDEYLLPKLEEDAANGWPDWAVLWSDRVWVIELKTEAGSHRTNQLPYYLELAAAAHPACSLDLTYITGPLVKPAPALRAGQRYSHLVWNQVHPLIKEAWGDDTRTDVAAYVDMVTMLVNNMGKLRPSEQRAIVLGAPDEVPTRVSVHDPAQAMPTEKSAASQPIQVTSSEIRAHLLDLAGATAEDGRQRAVGAQTPDGLEALRDRAVSEIGNLAPANPTRFVLPWIWDGTRTGGRALTPQGEEFGYELRFSRYNTLQVKPEHRGWHQGPRT